MGDLTLQIVVLRIAAVLLIAAVHGLTLAATACALGDPGPRYDGRLSPNPLRHADAIGGLLMVLFAAGWIRPVAIDPNKLRLGRAGLLAVVVAASCATLVLAVLLRLVRPAVLNLLPDVSAPTFFIFVEIVGQLSVAFTLFNLLPLPPLTGKHLLAAVLPQAEKILRRVQPWCVGLLALLIATGMMARLLAPADSVVARLVLAG
jgi:Zn-dependent protease